MNPAALIEKHYEDNPQAKEILLTHSRLVAKKAVSVAKKFDEVDTTFVKEAAMLHDIGIKFTYTPIIYCYGKKPYIAHITEGRKLLESEGLPKHALVAERHTGVGITKEQIEQKNLLLPARDMKPITLAEKIVAYADNFYRKVGDIKKSRSVDTIKNRLRKYGDEKAEIFSRWHNQFKT